MCLFTATDHKILFCLYLSPPASWPYRGPVPVWSSDVVGLRMPFSLPSLCQASIDEATASRHTDALCHKLAAELGTGVAVFSLTAVSVSVLNYVTILYVTKREWSEFTDLGDKMSISG